MRKNASNRALHGFLMGFLFHFLLFSYPVLSLLWRRLYPFITPEVGCLFLLLAVFSILLTVIQRKVRPAIINVLSALLITIIFMLQFDLLILGVTICALTSLIVALLLRTNFQLYGLPVLIMLIMGAYFDSFNGDDLILLKTAAMYHDSGMLRTYTGHEEASCEIANEYLPGFGYKTDEIDQINKMIMATKLPQNARNRLIEYHPKTFIVSCKLMIECKNINEQN